MLRSMRFKNWYPDNLKEIKSYLPDVTDKKDALSLVVPHAGWVYSGKTAGITYATSEIADIYIIICPNHTGLGSEVSIDNSDEWETPTGNLKVNLRLAEKIKENSNFADFDATAHVMEHSIEVQLPFIKAINPKAQIVPVCMGSWHYDKCKDLAQAIFKAAENTKKKIVVIASTDMTHYTDSSIAKICDNMAIESILDLNPKGLFDTVKNKDISMCGVSPTTTAIIYSNLKEAKKAELLKYSNSGDITGDFSEVVGYAGIIIY